MTIKEAWNVIATLDIELVEQYSVRECDRWHEAIQKLQVGLISSDGRISPPLCPSHGRIFPHLCGTETARFF